MRDRFRPNFCSADFYRQHMPIFESWSTLFSRLDQHKKTQYWTLGLILLRRPTDWFGGFRAVPFCPDKDSLSQDEKIILGDFLSHTLIRKPQKIDIQTSLETILNNVRLKPVPEVALQSLTELSNRKDQILILNHEPDPFEVLHLQSMGKRIITFSEDFRKWPMTKYGDRDVLSFVLHDLIHAHHFFSDLDSQKKQIGFYKMILKIKNDSYFKSLYQDPNFTAKFNYVISDMNAHPVHLLQTLRAHVAPKDKHNIIWSHWAMIWSQDKNDHDALVNINTLRFSSLNANQINSICSRES